MHFISYLQSDFLSRLKFGFYFFNVQAIVRPMLSITFFSYKLKGVLWIYKLTLRTIL